MEESRLMAQNLSHTSRESDKDTEDRFGLHKLAHYTDESGTTWYPDVESSDFEEELQRVLSRSSSRRRNDQSTSSAEKESIATEEKTVTPRKTLVARKFRGLVRVIMLTRSLPTHDVQPVEKPVLVEGSSIPHFNVSYYYRARKTLQLPHRVKVIMTRPPWLRTEEDKDLVFKSILTLKCFDKYPSSTLQKMAPYLNYIFVVANRVVVRQGHVSSNFYLILSGTLLVHREEKDPQTGIMTSKPAGKFKPGDTFGELALIHNIPRTMTVTTKYDSELLYLHKDEYDLLLKEKVQHEVSGRSRAIEALKEFHMGWTPEDRLECSNCAKIVNYKDNMAIFGDATVCLEFLYFIIGGQCQVVEVLQVLCESGILGRPLRLKMVTSENGDRLPSSYFEGTIVQRYIKISEFGKDQYFGCGEDLRRRFVIACGNVQCIQIPHSFIRGRGYAQWLELLHDKLEATLPTHDYVFRKFVEQATWRAFKKQQIAEVVRHAPHNRACTKILDVPKSIRIDEEVANWNNVLTSTYT